VNKPSHHSQIVEKKSILMRRDGCCKKEIPQVKVETGEKEIKREVDEDHSEREKPPPEVGKKKSYKPSRGLEGGRFGSS